MSGSRLFLVPMSMVLALGSLAFNVSSNGPLLGDVPDLDADGGGMETGPFDGGGLDGPPLDAGTCTDDVGPVCAPDGGMGCAGGGGLGGTGGQGGAASVALYAIGPTTSVTMTNGAFVIGHGGTGAPGGDGELGDQGLDGGTGSSVACKSTCSSACALITTLQPGSPGSGTNGGNGGKGGGGAGGPAYFYVTVTGATVDASAATLGASVNGLPGAGGQPNGPDGSAGVHP